MQALVELSVVAPAVAFLADHEVVVPALLLLAVLSVLLSGPVSRRTGVGRAGTALLLLACTAPFAMTLPPSGRGDGRNGALAERVCVTTLRPLEDWGRGGEELANVLLTVPAGLLLAALLPRGAAAVALALACCFPLLVEGVQYVLPGFGRTCEVTDVLLNLLGLAVGAALGLVLRGLRRTLRRHGRRGRAAPVRTAPPGPGHHPSASPGTSARR